MATYKAVQITSPGKFDLVSRPVPEPGPKQVRLRVEACGVCHTDNVTVTGGFPGLTLPRVPGHEVVGRIEALGADVEHWRIGQRVGVGFQSGHCGHCEQCRRGNFVLCPNQALLGVHIDGGYAEILIAPTNGLAAIPDELSSVDAAPLLCAGITTFNALRKSPARAGDVVAIQGVGGLGHLAIQFARRMGFHVVAISRGADKNELAKKLGAHKVVDSAKEDPVKFLQALGGAKVILATAAHNGSFGPLVPGLSADGQLVVVGAGPDGPLVADVGALIFGRRSIQGGITGTPIENEDTMKFSVLQEIKPMVQTFPLEKAEEAFGIMLRNEARFRVVLVVGIAK